MGIDAEGIPKCALWRCYLLIFVVLGTHELPFHRLLNEIEHLKQQAFIKEEVIVQHGHTPCNSKYFSLKKFVSYEEMDAFYDKARIVITHAGTGSVVTALRKGKKVIAVPRLKEYGEHNDNHQLEIVAQFLKQGYILTWKDGEQLAAVLKQAEDFKPQPFQSGKKTIFQLIQRFIEEA